MPQSQYAFRGHGLCMNTALSTEMRDVFSTKQMPTEGTSSSNDTRWNTLLQRQTTNKSICDVSHTQLKGKDNLRPPGTGVANNNIAMDMQYNIAPSEMTEHQWQTEGIMTPVNYQNLEVKLVS